MSRVAVNDSASSQLASRQVGEASRGLVRIDDLNLRKAAKMRRVKCEQPAYAMCQHHRF